MARYADMFSAMGPSRGCASCGCCWPRIPQGMVAGDIGAELDDSALDALAPSRQAEERRAGEGAPGKHVPLVLGQHRRAAGTAGFLYAECCTRNKAIEPQAIVQLCK